MLKEKVTSELRDESQESTLWQIFAHLSTLMTREVSDDGQVDDCPSRNNLQSQPLSHCLLSAASIISCQRYHLERVFRRCRSNAGILRNLLPPYSSGYASTYLMTSFNLKIGKINVMTASSSFKIGQISLWPTSKMGS